MKCLKQKERIWKTKHRAKNRLILEVKTQMKWTYMDEVQRNGFLNNTMMKQEINLLNFILQNEQRDIYKIRRFFRRNEM